jgi:nucleotide-binding universal stress UspA family protein
MLRRSTNEEVVMKPILLATDGSPSATEATREAIDIARVYGVPLVAVAVAHTSAAFYGGYPYYGYAEIYADLTKVAHDHASAVLDATAAEAAEAGVDCEKVAATTRG